MSDIGAVKIRICFCIIKTVACAVKDQDLVIIGVAVVVYVLLQYGLELGLYRKLLITNDKLICIFF